MSLLSQLGLILPEILAPWSLGVSVHARKRFPDLALVAMNNPLYPRISVVRPFSIQNEKKTFGTY